MALHSASALALMVAGASATQAVAQTAPQAAPAVSTVGEVIVTAQRRSESAQSVPLAVQVTTGTQLEQKHIEDTVGLTMITPTLVFAGGSSPTATSLSLRGIASLANNPGVQPSTALVVDDVPLVRISEYSTKLADIASVQILDGPQGTLFGKNSTAGVVAVTTVDPLDHFDAWIEGGVTTDKEYSTRGMVNLPLADNVQARVNYFYDDQRPLVHNLDPLGTGLAGDRSAGFQAKLAVQPTSKLDILTTINYTHDHSNYNGEIPIMASTYPNEAAVLGYTPHYGQHVINQNLPDLAINKFYSGTIRAKYEVSDSVQLTSITSYHNYQSQNVLDTDTTPIGNNPGVGYTPNPFNYAFQVPEYGIGSRRFLDKVNYWSEEDRVNYSNSFLKLVGGVFYQDVSGWTRSWSPTLISGTFKDNQVEAAYTDKTASVFGDATWAVTSTVNVFGGLRYTREQTHVDYHGKTFNNPASFFDPVAGVNTAVPVATANLTSGVTKYNLSGRVGVQWQPTSDQNFYASYSRGYKGPGLGLAAGQTNTQFMNVNPELADDYEVGAKLRFFERRLAVDLSVFDETIYGIQESSLVPGTIITELINAGKLRSKGVELSVDARVTSHFTLNGSASILDNYYGSFLFACNPQAVVGTGGCFLTANGASAQDLKGKRAIEAPPLKYTISARYENQLSSMPIDYALELDWTWTGRMQYALNEAPLTVAPSYGVLNASVDFKTRDGRWDLLFYGKNLTNKFFYDDLIDVPTFFGLTGIVSRDFKVYGGTKLRYHF